MFIVDKLLKPLRYIQISNNEKRWFDLWLPITFAVLVTVLLYLLPKPISFLGKDSIVSLTNGILQILSGFYIASMAAVATFNRDGMDDPMAGGDCPRLDGQKLTRRGFLSYLFGYLAFTSILMYFAGGLCQLMLESLRELFRDYPWIKMVGSFLYLTALFNIIFTTVLGMHFLIDRIHRSEPHLYDNNKQDKE
ncbi:hypothetical protein L1S45_22075 [Aeromonas dhakensis]|uniref:hypothetical protein n=1 Tax=Aeromonas dhakensis TaxID=196024 RepID=UPI00208EFDC3|nr:hypothetical protein [Aeromonas dhakensis]USP09803.1 hypothetical protein L1S45_22075 [Aeromonas dhakensis]